MRAQVTIPLQHFGREVARHRHNFVVAKVGVFEEAAYGYMAQARDARGCALLHPRKAADNAGTSGQPTAAALTWRPVPSLRPLDRAAFSADRGVEGLAYPENRCRSSLPILQAPPHVVAVLEVLQIGNSAESVPQKDGFQVSN
jgi:hypothetical protein